MTHYFKNKEGNKVIGVDGERVTEYDLMYTVGVNETFKDETLIVEPTKTVILKKTTTKRKAPTDLSNLTDEERRAKKKAYMKEYNKNYKNKSKVKVEKAIKKVVKDPSERAQVEFEPNQKLIQEFGKHVIDNIILCKRQGYTAEEIDDDKPAHCGHLVFGQIERIFDTVKS